MKIIKTKWFPFGSYKALNFFGILFTKGDLNKTQINHESIHTALMKEMLYVFFYLWYGIEYLIIWVTNLLKSLHDHYHEVSFEEEAYANLKNFLYLDTRKHYAWTQYLNPHSNE